MRASLASELILNNEAEKMRTLEVRSIGKTYSNGTEALQSVSFAGGSGDCIGYLGPNGAGKSTTVHILCTALKPTTGYAEVCGFDVVRNAKEVRKRIGLATQSTYLDWIISVEGNLKLFARLNGLSRKETRRKANELMSEFGLETKRKALAASLSGGQVRRLQLAIALLRTPEVLFLDEPTTGLDPIARRSLLDKLSVLLTTGTTILYSSHDMRDLEELCTKIVFLADGKVIASGPLRQFVDTHGGDQTATVGFVDTPSASIVQGASLDGKVTTTCQDSRTLKLQAGRAELASSLQWLVTHSGGINTISIKEPGLESAFMKILEEVADETTSCACTT